MALSPTPHGDGPTDPPGGSDPSMEDILASIRRILNEDEAAAPAAGAIAEPAAEPKPAADDNDVLMLDQSMMVTPPGSHDAGPAPERTPERTEMVDHEPPARLAPEVIAIPAPPAAAAPTPRQSELLAPESEAAAISSVGSLLRMLTAERTTQVHRGGPTIEDLVREEIRPLLKAWLDTHLPPLVERLVRTEIERVAGRAG